jgi:hypothetical protein
MFFQNILQGFYYIKDSLFNFIDIFTSFEENLNCVDLEVPTISARLQTLILLYKTSIYIVEGNIWVLMLLGRRI